MESVSDIVRGQIERRQIEELLVTLTNASTRHANTAKGKLKLLCIQELFRYESEECYQVATFLVSSANESAQEIGVILLTRFYECHPMDVEEQICRVANSQHWEVREWAASALGRILQDQFEASYPMLLRFAQHPDDFVRRAAVVGCKYASSSADVATAERIVDALTPLLYDPSKYVRENLGPFALGDALLPNHPDLILHHARNWVAEEDEMVRWNVAMMFSSQKGRPWIQQAKEIFDVLETDARPLVSRAVQRVKRHMTP